MDNKIVHNLEPYDAQQAHEYYLRTRQLKGRAAAAKIITSPHGKRSGANLSRQALIKTKNSGSNTSAITAQIAGLQASLSALKKSLSDLIGKVDSKHKSNNSSNTKKDPKEKLTASQKADARDRAKKSYEKNKKPVEKKASPSDEEAQIRAKIKDVEHKLRKMRAELVALRGHSSNRKSSSVGVRA